MSNEEPKEEYSPSRFGAEYLEDVLGLDVRGGENEGVITYIARDRRYPPLHYSGRLSEELDAFVIGSFIQREPLWGITLTPTGDILVGSSPGFSPKKVDILRSEIPKLIKDRISYYRAISSTPSKYCVSGAAYANSNILWLRRDKNNMVDA